MNVNLFSPYFNRIVEAARNGNLVIMPDQDVATVMVPTGINVGFQPENFLQRQYEALMNEGNIIVGNTGRPYEFFRTAYPEIHERLWLCCEMGALIMSPDAQIIKQVELPHRERAIDIIARDLPYFPGAFIEGEKKCGITIAVSGVENREECLAHFCNLAFQIASQNDGIHVRSGAHPQNSYVELSPDAVSKGIAAKLILNLPEFRDRLVVCIGDSEPDRDMMLAVNELGGISIGIGENCPEAAHFTLKDHTEAQDFIHLIAERQNYTPGKRSFG